MSIYNTGTTSNELWPGMKGFWDGRGKELPYLYTQYFDIESSEQKYEKLSEHYNTGLAKPKAEGSETEIGGFAQGASPEYYNIAYSLGIILTHESIKDNLYFKEGKDKIRSLRKSFYTTKEIVHANVLNNGFTSGFIMPNGDGKTLFATDHKNAGGTFSNRLSVGADLSETAIEDMLIQIKGAFDSTGVHKANIRGQKLLVSDSNWFISERILKSFLQNDTANNAVNALKSTGAIPQTYISNTYFTDSDAWFVKTTAEKGLTCFERESLDLYDDNEQATRNYLYYGYERYSVGWTDPRGVYGSPGA